MSNRRKFLSDLSKFSIGVGLISVNPSFVKAAKRLIPPSDTIKLGLIGARGMGFHILTQALIQPDTECVAICDIDDAVLNERVADVLELQDKKPKTFKDFRKLLEDKEIDAVIIGTPDHWHCLPMVYACEAGKDVYVEKPMANSLAELDIMVAAARKYKRVVQVGQQQRSGLHWAQALDRIKSGDIGQLRKVNIWANFNYGVGGMKQPDTSPAQGVDYNMWLGPAPDRSFNENRFHGRWRMFWDYGGGLLTDWGVHLIDMALWAKDVDYAPLAVTASGGNYSHTDHAHETFDTMDVSWQMEDYSIHWQNIAGVETGPYDRKYGLEFIGNDGKIIINRQSWEYISYADKQASQVYTDGKQYHEEHTKNFLECIKTRKDPACPVENGRLVGQYAHMGNIALRTNSRLEWDQTERNFGSNQAANELITPEYRAPWKLPKIS